MTFENILMLVFLFVKLCFCPGMTGSDNNCNETTSNFIDIPFSLYQGFRIKLLGQDTQNTTQLCIGYNNVNFIRLCNVDFIGFNILGKLFKIVCLNVIL